MYAHTLVHPYICTPIHLYTHTLVHLYICTPKHFYCCTPIHSYMCTPGLGSSTVDQVLKYIKYPKYIPSTSTAQVLLFLKSTSVHQVLSYQVQVLILKLVTLYYNCAISQRIVWLNYSNHIVRIFFHWSLISIPLFM